MPKHYCDYCDVFLTHDSASVRKAHNSGRNHLANVREYYASLGHDKAQSIIDQITSAYESGQGPPPGGFGFRPSDLGAPAPQPAFPPGGFPGPGFPPRPPFPPGPGGLPPFPPGMIPPGGPPPFPPSGFPGGPPPFPPSNPPGGQVPPFPPPNANGGPPPNFNNGGPPPLPPSQSGPPDPAAPGSGPVVHPDRLRMMSGP